ncbi:MAG TPA: TetR/AcrR family transcriptional regulator [Gaiellaceae bacterium]|nr:TetR/AcrR family transcriptional regulator [Gaiellaceae bacterium]
MSTTRLPAEERRAALLETACAVFSQGTYRGTTTAEIAREAGVTEPILYRHFDSKRDLYLACLEETWTGVQTMWEAAIEAEPDPALWVAAIGRSFVESEVKRPLISNLWVQALAEASEDPVIRAYMKGHMRAVHAYVVAIGRRAQSSGAIDAERDIEAEAWIFISLGLLSMADRVLDGVMLDKWPAIRRSRLRWLTGRNDPLD